MSSEGELPAFCRISLGVRGRFVFGVNNLKSLETKIKIVYLRFNISQWIRLEKYLLLI